MLTTISLIITSVFFVSYSVFAGWMTSSLNNDEIGIASALVLVAGYLVSALIILYTQYSLINKFVANVRLALQKDIAMKLLSKREDVSGILNIYNQEIDLVLNGYIRNIPFVITLTMSFLVAVAYASVLSWQITIGFVIVSLFTVVFNHLYRGRLASALENHRAKNTLINATVKGTFSNTKMINIFQANFFAFDRMERVFDSSSKAFVRNQLVTKVANLVNQSISNLLGISIIVVGFWLVSLEILTLGAVMTLMFLLPHISAPFRQIMDLKNSIDSTKEVRNRLSEIIATKNDELILDLDKSDIEFRNVSFTYDAHEFMESLSFTFEKGKKYLIIGESGSGKSTLLDLILKEITPCAGKITYGETSLECVSANSWYKNLGYVGQNISMIPGTLIDNIVLNDSYDVKKFDHIVKTLGLDYLENSMNVELNEEYNNFSGGELQRIAIARTLYKDSDIMIFDEITSALDPKNASIIEGYLAGIKDKIVISVSHRISESVLGHYDKIMLMEKGAIIYFDSYVNDHEGTLSKFISG
ncbi:MAG: ABC transporter ATP-binding protein/permease [Defluviitaleaceae bacterium]|nr:ABC transporter ATP-binding protein/permease [Defluviitaleaceae bacterium]